MRTPSFIAVATAAVFLFPLALLAQMSPEEAQQRLEARQAQEKAQAQQDAIAATQPSTLTNGEVAALRKTIAKQQYQIAQLQDQIQKLNSKLALSFRDVRNAQGPTNPDTQTPAEQPADTHAAEINAAMAQHTLAVGMTLDQCNQSMGKAGRVTGANTDGTFYEWDILVGRDNLGNPQASIQFTATIEDGKVVRFSKGDPMPFNVGSFGVGNQ